MLHEEDESDLVEERGDLEDAGVIGAVIEGPIFTRKLALIPENASVQEIKKDFQQLRTFLNQVVQHLTNEIKRNPSLVDSYADGKHLPNLVGKGQISFKSKFYDPLKSLFDTIADTSQLNLTERARRASTSMLYFALRNWVIRNEDLRIISRLLFEHIDMEVQGSYPILEQFLREGRLKNEYLGSSPQGVPAHPRLPDFNTELAKNPFKSKFRSYYLINNMIGQIRNILLSEGVQAKINLKPFMDKIKKLEGASEELPEAFQQHILHDFERKVKGVIQKIPPKELYDHFFKGFFIKVSKSMLEYAKSRLGNYSVAVPETIRRAGVQLFKDFSITTMEHFKEARKSMLDSLKVQLTDSVSKVDPMSELKRILGVAYKNTLKNYSGSKHLLNSVFKPSFLPNPVKSLDLEGFTPYIARRLENKLREHFSRLFIDSEILDGLKSALGYISRNIYSLTNIPEFKKDSLPLLYQKTATETGVFQIDYNTAKGMFFITLLSKRKAKQFKFKIRTTRKITQLGGNKKKRGNLIHDFISKGYIPLNPTISFNGEKILLNQPFVIRKEGIKTVKSETLTGVDLGLKDWAVISANDIKSNREVANYFLNPYRVFDNIFDPSRKKFIPRARFMDLRDRSKDKFRSTVQIRTRLGPYKVKPVLEQLIDGLGINRTINADILRWARQACNRILHTYLPAKFAPIEPDLLSKLMAGAMVCYLSALKRVKNAEDRVMHFSFSKIARQLALSDPKILQKFFVGVIQMRYLRPTNIKFKLMKLRSDVAQTQRVMAEIKNRNPKYLYNNTYKKASRRLSFLNSKINRLNSEIANQVAHQIVETAKAFKGTIRLEDLKWSRQSKKQDTGFWLSYWQQHWFYAKIIDTVKTLSEREGLEVELVVARGTSKKCSKDNSHTGSIRAGKEFSCPSHNYHVDSDLNAARNIALHAEVSGG